MHDTSARKHGNWPVGSAPIAASLLAVLTLLAFVAAWLNELAPILQLPIALGALALGGFAIRRLLTPDIRRLRIDGRRVRTEHACGTRQEGRVSGVPFVSPLFVGFRWRAHGRRWPRAIGLFREQLAPDDFRRLCATLRQQEER